MRDDQDTAEIDLRQITAVRTCMVRGDPKTVVLEITSGGHMAHYCLALSDLAGLAQRLGNDAALLGAAPKIRTA